MVPFSVIVAWCVDRQGFCLGVRFSSRLGRCKWASFHADESLGFYQRGIKAKVFNFRGFVAVCTQMSISWHTSAKRPEEHPNISKMKQYEAKKKVRCFFPLGPWILGWTFFTRGERGWASDAPTNFHLDLKHFWANHSDLSAKVTRKMWWLYKGNQPKMSETFKSGNHYAPNLQV